MVDGDEEYQTRKRLTFAQAEGAERLPVQLKRNEITKSLRARLSQLIYLVSEVKYFDYKAVFRSPISEIYERMWVHYFNRFIDDYPDPHTFVTNILRPIFEQGNYQNVFGFLQYLIRMENCPPTLTKHLETILESERAAFRIVNGDTFCPIGSPLEIQTIEGAINSTKEAGLAGAQSHLIEAARTASAGAFADSVRESIHAVESVARCLSARDGLAGALAVLELKRIIHRAMKTGFCALYGYTSDEKGIRHPLLDDGDAAVNETDALFMLGACASFISYMISRAREAGLISGDASS